MGIFNSSSRYSWNTNYIIIVIALGKHSPITNVCLPAAVSSRNDFQLIHIMSLFSRYLLIWNYSLSYADLNHQRRPDRVRQLARDVRSREWTREICRIPSNDQCRQRCAIRTSDHFTTFILHIYCYLEAQRSIVLLMHPESQYRYGDSSMEFDNFFSKDYLHFQLPVNPGFVPHLQNLEFLRQTGMFYPRISDLTGKSHIIFMANTKHDWQYYLYTILVLCS